MLAVVPSLYSTAKPVYAHRQYLLGCVLGMLSRVQAFFHQEQGFGSGSPGYPLTQQEPNMAAGGGEGNV